MFENPVLYSSKAIVHLKKPLTQCLSNWVSKTRGVLRNVDNSSSILYLVIISSSLLV